MVTQEHILQQQQPSPSNLVVCAFLVWPTSLCICLCVRLFACLFLGRKHIRASFRWQVVGYNILFMTSNTKYYQAVNSQ